MDYQQQYRPAGFRLLPPVVKNILIINVIMFLASLAFKYRFQIDLRDLLGLHYPTSPSFHWYQVFTYMFMHEGWDHIFFNMFGVWMFGYVLENYWGPRRFIIFYLVTALGAAFIQTLYTGYQLHTITEAINNFSPEEYRKIMSHYFEDPAILNNASIANLSDLMGLIRNERCIGASGALFGILLAYGMIFPNTELIMIFFPIPIKAKYFVAIYAGIELFSGLSQVAGDNIAHFAHLGGALFGVILILIWKRNRKFFY